MWRIDAVPAERDASEAVTSRSRCALPRGGLCTDLVEPRGTAINLDRRRVNATFPILRDPPVKELREFGELCLVLMPEEHTIRIADVIARRIVP